MNVVGPRATLKEASDYRQARDRLIVDFGWAVGLRNFEITGLKITKFTDVHPDEDFPGDYQRVEILGKGSKRRVVAVPNWLILDAQAYIKNDRAEALKNRKKVLKDEYSSMRITLLLCES